MPSDSVPDEAIVDPKERDIATATLDAVVAKHIYALTLDELAYVLDQFPVLQRRDMKAHRAYVTKDRILECYGSV